MVVNRVPWGLAFDQPWVFDKVIEQKKLLNTSVMGCFIQIILELSPCKISYFEIFRFQWFL